MADKKFLPALTGIRALCAYGIFFYHTNLFSKEKEPKLFTFVDQFYSFIPFFFVISGFVIFYNYYKETKYTKKELLNYFISRVARIFPILIIINTAVFLLAYRDNLFTIFQSVKLYFLNITLLKGFSSEYFLTGVGPSWTNTIEEIFYLLAPLVFILIRRKRFLLKFILLFYLMGFLITSLFIRFPYDGIFSSYIFTAYSTFFGRVFEFATGIYLAMLYLDKYRNRFLEKFGVYTMLVGVALLLSAFILQYYIAIQSHSAHAISTWPGIIVNNFLFPVGIFLVLYNLLYHQSILRRILSSSLMVKLGNATYSFYLLHTTFILSYIFKFISTNVFIALIVMIVVSYIFHKAVEQPLAILIRNKFSKKTSATS